MQDRYIGDVGDFGKYALLRRLAGIPTEKSVNLGIVWCYFPNESHNNDGKHTAYLEDERFIKLDEELRNALRRIVSSDERSIASVLSSGILPREMISCHGLITSERARGPAERILRRAAWLTDCLEFTRNCDLVFFDPDNGLEPRSVKKTHPKAGKYIYWDEIAPFWHRQQTILIYHHVSRTAPAARQIALIAERFSYELKQAVAIPLVFRRGSSRVFWLVHHGDRLGREIERRAAEFLKTGWHQHFRPFGWPLGLSHHHG